MSGKQHKRELKRARRAAREEARRRERRRTLQTIAIIAGLVLLGGVVIAVSLRSENASLADAPPTPPTPTDAAGTDVAAAACTPDAPPASALGEGDRKPTFPDGPDDVLQEGQDYRATVETSCGTIAFDLFEDDAPETVNSFVFLAQQGFFDGLRIFRNATSISALQTGAGDNTNTWDVGYTIPDEFDRAQAQGGYQPGDLAMAKTGAPDSGGSQFFMVYGDTDLPPEYTLFGTAVEGLEVLQSIGAIPTADPANPAVEEPGADVYLESVTVEATPAASESPQQNG